MIGTCGGFAASIGVGGVFVACFVDVGDDGGEGKIINGGPEDIGIGDDALFASDSI